MKISKLISALQSIQDEVGTGGKHSNISGDVNIMCYDSDIDLDIVSVEPDRVMGCGCWIGAYLVVTPRDISGHRVSAAGANTPISRLPDEQAIDGKS